MRIPILAAKIADLEDKANSWGKSASDFFAGTGITLVVAFAVGVALLVALICWARFFRNRRKHVTGGEKVYRPGHTPSAEEADSPEMRRRYKRRVRRRGHRARNPTIAETGGLPPVRTEQRSDPT